MRTGRYLAAALILNAAVALCAPPKAKTETKTKAKAKSDAGVVGSWGRDGETLFVFKADGTGKMERDDIRWSVEGRELTIKARWGTEKLDYRLKDGRLTLVMGGAEQTFERLGSKAFKASPEPSGGEPGAAKPAARVEPGAEDRLSALLLSSAWCSFSYNKVSGSSSSKRVSFGRDGSWSKGAQSEGYSSGSGGTMASQHDSGGGGRWAVQGGRLSMSNPAEGAYELAPLDLKVTQNSNGSPILNADGVEYSQCR